jgi:hypothetical protein
VKSDLSTCGKSPSRDALPLDEPLICWHTGGGWYVILCGDRLRQIGGASVEGTAEEMRALADALADRRDYSAGRCRVVVPDGHAFVLSSPRNTITPTEIPMRYAAGLVASIREETAKPVQPYGFDGEEDA